MRLEPALVNAPFELSVAGVIEVMEDVELLVPLLLELLGRELETKAVDLADLAALVSVVEFVERGARAHEVTPAVPEHVVEVAGHPWKQLVRIPLEHTQSLNRRAVVIEIEGDEADRGVPRLCPRRHCVRHVPEDQLCALET